MNMAAQMNPLTPWINHLSTDWRLCRLDAVADVIFSNVDKHTIEDEAPVRLCNYVDVYRNERITSKIDFMEASAEPHEIKKFQIRNNDVLVTKDSETPDDIAISALVADDLPGVICGYHLALIRARSRMISGAFLAWLHASKPFRAHYEARAVGVTRFGLSQHSFRELLIPLPPLSEQDRIAAYLGESCAAIDAAVAAKRRQIETLDKLQQLYITKAVTHGVEKSVPLKDSGIEVLGLIPHHWRRTKLRYEAAISNGDFISDKLEDDGIYPVIGGNGQMGRTSGYNTDGEIVVVGRVGANCGNAHYVKGRAWISDNALVVHSNHDKRFLMYLFRALDFNSMARRTAQPLITSTQIKNTYVALPKIDEQLKIADFIQKQITHFDELRENLKKQIDTLLAYRKSLIHECVTGQRRIPAEDAEGVQRGDAGAMVRRIGA